MQRLLLLMVVIAVVVCLEPGCGSEPTSDAAADVAGPNRRLKLKDEYKKAVDKDGHMIMKPGPPKITKSSGRIR